jgi:hypothetical protein
MFDASNFSWFWYLFILRAKQLTTKPLGQKANHLVNFSHQSGVDVHL